MHFSISRSNLDKRAIVFFESSSDDEIVLATSKCMYFSLHDFSDIFTLANSSSHFCKSLSTAAFSFRCSSFKRMRCLTFDSKLSNNSFCGTATLSIFPQSYEYCCKFKANRRKRFRTFLNFTGSPILLSPPPQQYHLLTNL